MKKYLIASLLVGAAITSAEAQTRRTFTAPAGEERREQTEQRTAPVTTTREAGAIPRAVRGRNPLQILNPAAPRRYFGPPEETVTHDPQNPSRVTGLILFGLRW